MTSQISTEIRVRTCQKFFIMNNKSFEININDIIKYLGDSKRPLVEGEQVYKANHIIVCGLKETNSAEYIQIAALCQSSSQVQQVHQIEMKLELINNEINISAKCSCIAGAGGKCKHIFATLVFLNRNDMKKLETITCTDLKQEWGKYKKNKCDEYAAGIPLSKMCHFQENDDETCKDIDDNERKLYSKMLIQAVPKSEIAIHISCSRTPINIEDVDVTSDLMQLSLVHSIFHSVACNQKLERFIIPDKYKTNFYIKHVEITLDKAIEIAVGTTNNCDNIWKLERKLRITASVCYELFTYMKNRNPDWEKKVKNVFFNTFSGSAATRHGVINEPLARIAYQLNFPNHIIESVGLIIHPDLPWLGCTPDGIIWEQRRLIEIKCPVEGKDKTIISTVDTLSYIKKNEYGIYYVNNNHKYYAQIQLSMYLTNTTSCHLIIYATVDSSFVYFEVLINLEYITKMLQLLRLGYVNNILPIIEKFWTEEGKD